MSPIDDEALAAIQKALPGRQIIAVKDLPGINFVARQKGVPDVWGWYIATQALFGQFDGIHIRLDDFLSALRLTRDTATFYAVVVRYGDNVVAQANLQPFFPIVHAVTVRQTGDAVVHIASRSLQEIH